MSERRPGGDGDADGSDAGGSDASDSDSTTHRVRVRGIYATALTRSLLSAGHEVVQASPPIRRRFDADLPAADHDASVETTDDRQGVGVAGDPAAVADLRDHLLGVGVDALAWDDPAPLGTVFDGVVTETLGGGAVVDLGEVGDDAPEGYLPFGNADDHVAKGDAVRVQVLEAAAPWADDRAVLDTRIRAMAGLATLVPGREGVRVSGADDADARELAGMTDLLAADVPDGWGIEWSRDARDASMDALGDALARASDRARTLESALEEPRGEPGPLASPTAGAWVWFGRSCRFALDETRREVTTTMPGHHRTKAASRSASAGVDLAEALVASDEFSRDSGADTDFPFGVVADQFGPREGDRIAIGHGKPDGRLIVLGRGDVTDLDPADGSLTLERRMSAGGSYDALDARREAGDVATTTFREGRWWYPTVYRDEDGDRKGTYVNVCTPVEAFPDSVRYVDLHVDVVKHGDGRVERVDDDELDEAVERGEVTEELAEKARSVASALERAL
ncbi:DUF402 domain-containing protein [Halobaculum sp. CBA1158]|uniref:DUF402 domain-containing protein n=1 Tax=Halobaculum sp. CBA1158 TaxID=2904243 RepID=UPI001F1F3A5C|nr:DUF402 domain-containing protein [Halobaculum sp. CBA1158]UIP00638.1 DUF402 domain-containing protein [Halobaculum sp. CBA1158]